MQVLDCLMYSSNFYILAIAPKVLLKNIITCSGFIHNLLICTLSIFITYVFGNNSKIMILLLGSFTLFSLAYTLL